MSRKKERFYIFNIKDGDRGDDTEAFIKAALDHEQIHKWAYVLHDKEVAAFKEGGNGSPQ